MINTSTVSDKSCREKQNTLFMSSILFRKSCHLWDNVKNNVQPDRPEIILTALAHCMLIPKATGTHSEYVILTVFPQQQWLHERASMLYYTNIACLVLFTDLHKTL